MKRWFSTCLVIILLLGTTSLFAQNYIATLAGNGLQSYSGDGGPATNAQLSGALAVRGDAVGNIYIVDGSNYRLRKVDASTGIITTIAGNGVQGSSGDGGPAVNAAITGGAICIDHSGNIYITDSNRIRKIDATTGLINTFAGTGISGYSGDGGAAISAAFNNLCGLFADTAGNIYICDGGNNAVRKIDHLSNIITTVAGNSIASFSGDGGPAISAALNGPVAVCLDNAGNMYIADNSNRRVRKVPAATVKISTFAGTGGYGVGAGDGGPAVNAVIPSVFDIWADGAGAVFIADYVHTIRKIQGGIINTIAGNAGQGYNGDSIAAVSAQLHYPGSVYADVAGNIFIGDNWNHRIRKISTWGTISTFAGGAPMSFAGDGGPCADAELNLPMNIAVSPANDIYVSDYSNNRIRKINAAGTITTIAGGGSAVSGFGGDGGAATNATLYHPRGISLDAAGNIYFADSRNFRVRKIDAATGTISTVAGNGSSMISGDGLPATDAAIWMPSAVCVDETGNLYIAAGNTVRAISAATSIISTIAGTGGIGYSGDGGPPALATFGEIAGMCRDGNGDLYICDSRFNVVRKISFATGTINTVAGNGYVLTTIEMGNYFYSGGYSGDGGPATDAKLNVPWGIFVDPAETLYIADGSNNMIRTVTADGIIHAFAGNTIPGFNGDGGLATNARLNWPTAMCMKQGSLLIADCGNNRIRKITNPTAVNNVETTIHFSIVPNPSTGLITITTDHNTKFNTIDIYNIVGQKIFHSEEITSPLKMDISNEPTGIYIVSASYGGSSTTQKFVIAR
ncbi:NHL domain-containing protein [Flavipsychrobacter stenotrophus]|nr:T9SS type A sorting domain-containing protein [Flavipsychrobacter stenotrophus]